MPWSVTADPVNFLAAVAWFRKRVAIPKAEWRTLTARNREKAFTVAGVAQLDVIHHVWKAIDKALSTGTSLEDFKRDVTDSLLRAWRGTVDDPPWRVETIFRTNVQSNYGAGRYYQATKPEVLQDRPVWMFDAILDGRETPVCRACDGTKRPADDPWWQTHTPPLHFSCRSSFIALTPEQAGKLTQVAPSAQADTGFGRAPSEATAWKPNLADYPPELSAIYQDKQR